MLFSVIIATRDRPTLFKRALHSVLNQSHADIDIHVVMDGSSAENADAYSAFFETLEPASGKAISVHKLIHREKGHGQSYSFNHGVSKASGAFVTFLDDDDEWTDAEHLDRVSRAITAAENANLSPDYLMCNQHAFVDKEKKTEPVWLEDLEDKLRALDHAPFNENFYCVAIKDLFLARGFCHLNTSIIRKSLYQELDGMDEGIRWECDRDLFLRVVEAAKDLIFIPSVVSKHYVPNATSAPSMTTRASALQKRLFQIQVMQKILSQTQDDTIHTHCEKGLRYAMQKLSTELEASGLHEAATLFNRMQIAAAIHPKAVSRVFNKAG